MRAWAVVGIWSAAMGLAACGGNVVVDHKGGAGGAGGGIGAPGGAGGATPTTIPVAPECGPETGLPDAACTPTAADCHSATNPCLAVHENGGASQFHLRISQLTLTKPAALTNPVIQGLFEDGTTPPLPDCNLSGSGLISWVLSFDLGGGALAIGGAAPQDSPLAPYELVNLSLMGLDTGVSVQQASAPLVTGGACQFETTLFEVNLPVYIGEPVPSIVLPLRAARIAGELTGGSSCIGEYNAAELDAAEACEPSGDVRRFTPGGAIEGLISLVEADNLPITSLQRTLCVLLTGEQGVPEGGTNRCQKDAAGNVVAKGDACLATGQPATADCADAFFFEAAFAASGVEVAP